MKITECSLDGVKLIEPSYHQDFRGYYCESYSARTLQNHGIENTFVQDNHILSLKKGVLRGIHFQNNPYAQVKLVRCIAGSFLDVIVDLRKSSSTYKKWISIFLSAENKKQVLIPAGFGHGCLSLEDNTEIVYKVDNFYMPELDRAIIWDDPELAIDWGIENPILSEKDLKAPKLCDSDINF